MTGVRRPRLSWHAVRPARLDIGGDGPLTVAALLWDAGPGTPGIVVVHGAGSRKENHGDFAAACAASGMSVLSVDLRGHGETGGDAGPGMLDDVLAGLRTLEARGHGPLGLRGSSLGGFLALHAAARHDGVRAVVAICPARPESLARLFEADWPLEMPLLPAVTRHDGVARGYWHATRDERVPWQATFALAQATPRPRHLRIVLGGTHQSLQHDPAVRADTVAFLARHLAEAGA